MAWSGFLGSKIILIGIKICIGPKLQKLPVLSLEMKFHRSLEEK
jgi:hypothetical protein